MEEHRERPGGRILVVGSSHLIAIRQAAAEAGDAAVEFFHFRRQQRDLAAFAESVRAIRAQGPVPDRVFLAFGGNEHNMIGLVRDTGRFVRHSPLWVNMYY